MKFFSVLIIVFFSHMGWAQLNPNQINFGQLKYDFLNEPLTQQELESILNTFSSLGDKEVILEEVVKSFLIESNTIFADSLITFWLNDYTKEDSSLLLNIPAIKNDFRERAFNMVFLSCFAKGYMDSISLIEAYIIIMKDKSSYFPNLPEPIDFNDFVGLIHSLYNHSKWFLSNPEEMLYFENLMKSYTISVLGNYSEEKLLEFVEIVKNDLKNRRSIYELYLPLSLSDYFESQQKLTTSQKQIPDKLDKEHIESFIKDAYYKVFNEIIPAKNLLDLKTYCEDNNLYDSKVIYLALIFSRYE